MAVNGQGKNTGVMKPLPVGAINTPGHIGGPNQPGPGKVIRSPRPLPTTSSPYKPMKALKDREVEDSSKVTKNKNISRKQKSMIDRLKNSAGKMNNKQKSSIQMAAAKRKAGNPRMPQMSSGVSNKLRAMADR